MPEQSPVCTAPLLPRERSSSDGTARIPDDRDHPGHFHSGGLDRSAVASTTHRRVSGGGNRRRTGWCRLGTGRQHDRTTCQARYCDPAVPRRSAARSAHDSQQRAGGCRYRPGTGDLHLRDRIPDRDRPGYGHRHRPVHRGCADLLVHDHHRQIALGQTGTGRVARPHRGRLPHRSRHPGRPGHDRADRIRAGHRGQSRRGHRDRAAQGRRSPRRCMAADAIHPAVAAAVHREVPGTAGALRRLLRRIGGSAE